MLILLLGEQVLINYLHLVHFTLLPHLLCHLTASVLLTRLPTVDNTPEHPLPEHIPHLSSVQLSQLLPLDPPLADPPFDLFHELKVLDIRQMDV